MHARKSAVAWVCGVWEEEKEYQILLTAGGLFKLTDLWELYKYFDIDNGGTTLMNVIRILQNYRGFWTSSTFKMGKVEDGTIKVCVMFIIFVESRGRN